MFVYCTQQDKRPIMPGIWVRVVGGDDQTADFETRECSAPSAINIVKKINENNMK